MIQIYRVISYSIIFFCLKNWTIISRKKYCLYKFVLISHTQPHLCKNIQIINSPTGWNVHWQKPPTLIIMQKVQIFLSKWKIYIYIYTYVYIRTWVEEIYIYTQYTKCEYLKSFQNWTWEEIFTYHEEKKERRIQDSACGVPLQQFFLWSQMVIWVHQIL